MFKNIPYVQTIILNDNPDLGNSEVFLGNFWADCVKNLKHLHLVNVRIMNLHIFIIEYRISGIKLKSLILDWNLISHIPTGIYKGLKTLEVISITYNQMSLPIDLIAELLELPNLRYLNLSHQNQLISARPKRVRRHHEHERIWIQHFCYRGMTCIGSFPKNLTHLDHSYSGFQLPAIPEIAMMNNNSLQFVYLSSNSIRRMPKPFYCPFTKPSFRLVDLSNNNIECINSSYFSHCDWSCLNVLNLRGNRMREVYDNVCNHNMTYFLAFLRPLWNLTKLDLSGNIINNNLHLNSFEKQNLLEELYISQMGLKNLAAKISHMKRLKYLDVSFNNLQCLSREVMMKLSNLSSIQKTEI